MKKIIWPLNSQKQLANVYKYILSDSYQNAEKVKKEILESVSKLAINPESHPRDKYRKDNDGNFRAFEIHSYRIAYKITDEEIIIVRIRHSAREPKLY